MIKYNYKYINFKDGEQMIKVKLEKNKRGNIIFKLKISDKEKENILFKRALMESKIIKNSNRFNYEVPLRFFVPICRNTNKDNLQLDKRSLLSYLEFSDYYDENYYTEVEATANYMKKWRSEGCPDIYKITIDEDTYEIKKEIVFKKPQVSLGSLDL